MKNSIFESDTRQFILNNNTMCLNSVNYFSVTKPASKRSFGHVSSSVDSDTLHEGNKFIFNLISYYKSYLCVYHKLWLSGRSLKWKVGNESDYFEAYSNDDNSDFNSFNSNSESGNIISSKLYTMSIYLKHMLDQLLDRSLSLYGSIEC